jgi:hypothetical protein
MSEDSRTTTDRNLEEYRRYITCDTALLNTQLLDLIQSTGPTRLIQSRYNTARAVTTRLRDRSESLRLLLGGDPTGIPSRQTSSDVSHPEDLTQQETESDSGSEFSENAQEVLVGPTSVSAFRTALRSEAVQLAVDELTRNYSSSSLSLDIDDFHDLGFTNSSVRPQVQTTIQAYHSVVFGCSLASFTEQVRLNLALQRDRQHVDPAYSA